ncbi:MAG TPA: PaaI family thioesterase [Acidimicrobiales bacterium]|nr:PaaI family thioesterase [Acidimicrobiales bacterium]
MLDELAHRFRLDEERVAMELDVTDEMRGPSGAVHGGLVASLIDCAGATAVARASGRPVATANASISYLAAGRVGPLLANASAIRVGSNHGVAEVRVCDAGQGDRPVASALVTLSFLSGKAFTRR